MLGLIHCIIVSVFTHSDKEREKGNKRKQNRNTYFKKLCCFIGLREKRLQLFASR